MSYLFDGVDDHLIVADEPVNAHPLTIVGWFKADNITASGPVAGVAQDHPDGLADDNSWILVAAGAVAGDPVRATTTSTSSANAATSTGYSAGVWHHGAAVFVSSAERHAFIDGGSKNTNVTNRAPVSGLIDSVIVAARNDRLQHFDGRIAEVAIWNVALSDIEVAALAAGADPRTIRPGNLVGYWPLRDDANDDVGARHLTVSGAVLDADHPDIDAVEGYGGVILTTPDLEGYWRLGESSGNTLFELASGKNLTIPAGAGRPTLGAAGALSGDADTGVLFDGIDDGATRDARIVDVAAGFSLEGWFKLPAGTTAGMFAFGQAKSNSNTPLCHIANSGSNGGRFRAVLRTAGNIVVEAIEPSGDHRGDGVYHHVVGTFTVEGSQVRARLYVDGVEVASGLTTLTMADADYDWAAAGGLYRNGAIGSFFAATMDELAAYSRPLTAAEVLEHYEAGTDAGGGTTHEQDVDDTTAVGDQQAKAIGSGRADQAAAADAHARAVAKAQADAAEAADARSIAVSKAQADATQVADAASTSTAYRRTIADGVHAADQANTGGATAWTLSINDGLSASDQQVPTLQPALTYVDYAGALTLSIDPVDRGLLLDPRPRTLGLDPSERGLLINPAVERTIALDLADRDLTLDAGTERVLALDEREKTLALTESSRTLEVDT